MELSQEWREHSETRKYVQYLQSEIYRLRQAWAEGAFTGESLDETVQLNAKFIGVVQGFTNALEIIKDGGVQE
jgi:hypothetical protein